MNILVARAMQGARLGASYTPLGIRKCGHMIETALHGSK